MSKNILLDECCCSVPLKTGCIVTGVIEFVCFVIDAFTYDRFNYEFTSSEEWVIVFRVIIVGVCSSLITFGSSRLFRKTAVLLHSLLLTLFLLVNFFFEVLVFKFRSFHDLADGIVWVYTGYYAFLVHSVFIGYLHYWKVSRPVSEETVAGVLRDRQMSTIFANQYYGI
ncbi:uncharacterized protein LOC116159003 [Photinus pyralis]|uniref:uncharacterized protein LOC116159003 n=1 Tax=Photinus pyralis TaxID=7054 RepID=UPI0012673BFE|nr:uncharacterized protein LOC116159003 [Photinus pyralis]